MLCIQNLRITRKTRADTHIMVQKYNFFSDYTNLCTQKCYFCKILHSNSKYICKNGRFLVILQSFSGFLLKRILAR